MAFQTHFIAKHKLPTELRAHELQRGGQADHRFLEAVRSRQRAEVLVQRFFELADLAGGLDHLEQHFALANELFLLGNGRARGLDQGGLHFAEKVFALLDELFLPRGGNEHGFAEGAFELAEVLAVGLGQVGFSLRNDGRVVFQRVGQCAGV